MHQIIAILALLYCVQAQQQCTKAGTAFCSEDENGLTGGPIILHCQYATGQAQPGNCNDELADVPPAGVKNGAYCWQTSPTTGDAQCTFNCVMVTAANGTTFYPLGCNRSSSSSSSLSSSSSSSSSLLSSSSAGSQLSSTSTVGDSSIVGATSSTSSSLRSFGQSSATATSPNTQSSARSTTSASSTNAAGAKALGGEGSLVAGVLGLMIAIL